MLEPLWINAGYQGNQSGKGRTGEMRDRNPGGYKTKVDGERRSGIQNKRTNYWPGGGGLQEHGSL